jgi:hypothetical protein
MSPLARMSRAVSSNSLVSLGLPLAFLLAFAIGHLDQKSISERLRDFVVVGGEPPCNDYAQGHELVVIDVFALVLGEAVQDGRPIRPVSDQQAKAATLTLAGPGDALLDDAAAEIGVVKPRMAFSTASTRLPSLIPSRLVKRASALVLKIRKVVL